MMRPQYSITTQPIAEPVSVDQASAHLRVDSTDDLEYIEGLVSVAREYAEMLTGRVCLSSKWLLIAPSWECLNGESAWNSLNHMRSVGELLNTFAIHRTPLVSIQSVKYYAPGDSVLTTMSNTIYQTITTSEPGMVRIPTLPSVDDRADAIQIAFTAGHATADLVPATMKHAIKMIVAHLYENRLPVAFASCNELPHSLNSLLENLRVKGWCA